MTTAIQAANMTRGTTGVCVLAAQAGAQVHVIDVGIDSEPLPGVVNMRMARGCGNIARGPAMRRDECVKALLLGVSLADQAAGEGILALGTGDMGIANTTPSTALAEV